MTNNLPMNEQETVITFTRLGDQAMVFTTDIIMRKQLLKLADRYPDEYQITDKTTDGLSVTLPKKRIRFAHSQTKANYTQDGIV